jgi:hypothetical protein
MSKTFRFSRQWSVVDSVSNAVDEQSPYSKTDMTGVITYDNYYATVPHGTSNTYLLGDVKEIYIEPQDNELYITLTSGASSVSFFSDAVSPIAIGYGLDQIDIAPSGSLGSARYRMLVFKNA